MYIWPSSSSSQFIFRCKYPPINVQTWCKAYAVNSGAEGKRGWKNIVVLCQVEIPGYYMSPFWKQEKREMLWYATPSTRLNSRTPFEFRSEFREKKNCTKVHTIVVFSFQKEQHHFLLKNEQKIFSMLSPACAMNKDEKEIKFFAHLIFLDTHTQKYPLFFRKAEGERRRGKRRKLGKKTFVE